MMSAAELASLLGAMLLCLLLRRRTGRWATGPLIAILAVAAAWPLLLWLDPGHRGLHLPGALGRGADVALHPLLTALWQVPIVACAGAWLHRGVRSGGDQ
jgi:hypothetical protein